MSKLVKKHKDVVNGDKITYLPDTTNIDTINNFACTQNIYMDPAEDWMVLEIVEFLRKQKSNIVLFQAPDACPDDPWIHKKGYQKYLHSLNNEAYFSIISQYVDNNDLIEKILFHGGDGFYLLGIMTSLPESMDTLPAQLTDEILEELVIRSSCFFVHAFDDESFVICYC